jgi:dolichol kinase
MNGALKAAWALTVLVAVAGVVLWLLTGRAVFAVFLVLAVLTAVGAWLTGRSLPKENNPS